MGQNASELNGISKASSPQSQENSFDRLGQTKHIFHLRFRLSSYVHFDHAICIECKSSEYLTHNVADLVLLCPATAATELWSSGRLLESSKAVPPPSLSNLNSGALVSGVVGKRRVRSVHVTSLETSPLERCEETDELIEIGLVFFRQPMKLDANRIVWPIHVPHETHGTKG